MIIKPWVLCIRITYGSDAHVDSAGVGLLFVSIKTDKLYYSFLNVTITFMLIIVLAMMKGSRRQHAQTHIHHAFLIYFTRNML